MRVIAPRGFVQGIDDEIRRGQIRRTHIDANDVDIFCLENVDFLAQRCEKIGLERCDAGGRLKCDFTRNH